MKRNIININHNDDPDLVFAERQGDRRTNGTKSNGIFFKRKVGDRSVVGKERRNSDRRNEMAVVDITGITLWTSDDITELDITVPRFNL